MYKGTYTHLIYIYIYLFIYLLFIYIFIYLFTYAQKTQYMRAHMCIYI